MVAGFKAVHTIAARLALWMLCLQKPLNRVLLCMTGFLSLIFASHANFKSAYFLGSYFVGKLFVLYHFMISVIALLE
jgi:hypothetical protein